MYDDPVMQRLEAAKKTTTRGGEYWTARKIKEVMGYAKWDNFKGVIGRAIESCRSGGIDARDHFLGTRKMVTIGSGAKVKVEDYFLTRYACYLVAMNGESSKAEEEHKRVGRVVRRTIQKELGVSPEDLRAEPSIKEISSTTKRQLPGGGTGNVSVNNNAHGDVLAPQNMKSSLTHTFPCFFSKRIAR